MRAYKKVPLSQGYVAIVDADDYDLVMRYKWHYSIGYAKRKLKRPDGTYTSQGMHRLVMGDPKGVSIDHRSMNTLDNRKENLRTASKSDQACNVGIRKDNTSGYKGIGFDKKWNKWTAEIQRHGKRIRLGRFVNIQDAIAAYKAIAIQVHGEFVRFKKPTSKIKTTI